MALSVACGNFQKSTGGAPASQAIIGLGFTPKVLFLWSTLEDSFGSFVSECEMAHGMTTGASQSFSVCMAVKDGIGTAAKRRCGTKLLTLIDSTPTLLAECDLTSFDSDGFTLSWTTNNLLLYKICYLALGGSAITNAKVFNFQTDSTDLDKAITTPGFLPNCTVFMSTADTVLNSTSGTGEICMGFQGAAAGQGEGDSDSATMFAVDGGTANTARRLMHQYCLNMITVKAGAPSDAGQGYVSSYDATGFTFSQHGFTLTYYVGCLAMAIEGAKASIHTSPASTGTQNGPSLTFTPRAALYLSVGAAKRFLIGGIDNDAGYTIGAMTGASARGTAWAGSKDNVAPNESDQLIKNDKAISIADYGSPTIEAEADFSAMAATWTLNWTLTTKTEDYVALTLGEATLAGQPAIRRFSQTPHAARRVYGAEGMKVA